ncbi:antiviral innate immune response effector IFIT1-like [Lithobates pipiens]
MTCSHKHRLGCRLIRGSQAFRAGHHTQFNMSEVLKRSLKSRLTKLQCHFTWNLLDEEADIDKVKDRLYDQIAFVDDSFKYRIYNILAYTSYLNEDYVEATAYLQKAEEQLQEIETQDTYAKSVIIYANYAWIFYHRNHIIKVYKYLKKVQEIREQFESPPKQNDLLFEMYSEKGFCLLTFHGRHSERAKDCFKKALDLDPENPELNSSYAIAVFKLEGYNCLKKPLDESFPLLKQAAQINPKDTVVKVFLGLKYQDLNNSKEGLRLIEDALKGTPEFPYLLRYVAKFYRREKMIDEAILVLNEATRLNPASSHLHHQLAQCYKKKMTALKTSARKAKLDFQCTRAYTEEIADAVSSAIFHLEKATENKSTFVTAHIALACMYGRAKQYQKADERFHRVLTMSNLTQEEKQDLHLNWAQYEQYKTNCQSEAIKHYKEVLTIKCPTIFREYALKQSKSLAEEILTKNKFDDTGIDFLHFIHEQDVILPKSAMSDVPFEHNSENEE